MRSRRRRWQVLLFGMGLALFAGVIALWFGKSKPVSLLLITLDTTRADRIGCYGYSAAFTPTLDALAARSILFERASASAPLTLPSHATMFTGLNPPEHGLRDNGRGKLSPDIPTLAKILHARKYRTGAFVGSFVLDSKFGLDLDFDVYDDNLEGSEYSAETLHRRRTGDRVVQSALEWLSGRAAEPFFCWIHLYDPHAPYQARPETFGQRFEKVPYDAGIAFTDQQVGRVLKYLRDQGLEQQTLVVVVGDHGEGLGEHGEREHGNMLYNSTLHVPLIIAPPDLAPTARRVSTPVSLVDILPTILDCLGVDSPSGLSGRRLNGAWSRTPLDNVPCYAETDVPYFVHGWAPLRSLTTDKWKYIRTTRVELYDLEHDPHETRNLALQQPAQVAELERQLSDLEQHQQPRGNDAVTLSSAERQRLAGLGYLGGRNSQPWPPGEALPDMKDMQHYHDVLVDARHALEAGAAAKAVELLQGVVEALPDHRLSRVFLGEALLQTGQTEAAIRIFRELLKQEPDRPDVLVQLGVALSSQEDWKGAAQQFQQAVDSDPDLAEGHYRLAVSLMHLQQRQPARAQLSQCLALDPGFVAARLELASMLAQEGQIDAALHECQTVLKYRKDWPEAHATWARILASQNQLDEAIEHAEQAVKLDPLNADWHYNLGIYWAIKGDLERAIPALSEAVRLQPEHPHAQEQLARLQKQKSPPESK